MSYSSLNSDGTLSTHTSVGIAGAVYASGSVSNGWSNISANVNLFGNTLDVKGDANFDGDVTVKGKSINDSLERIEERLAILRPNEELEQKWENLRGLRKMYMELEAEIIEKEKVWGILKK
jgi:hypothetical protein